jgi:hypothetical protein
VSLLELNTTQSTTATETHRNLSHFSALCHLFTRLPERGMVSDSKSVSELKSVYSPRELASDVFIALISAPLEATSGERQTFTLDLQKPMRPELRGGL